MSRIDGLHLSHRQGRPCFYERQSPNLVPLYGVTRFTRFPSSPSAGGQLDFRNGTGQPASTCGGVVGLRIEGRGLRPTASVLPSSVVCAPSPVLRTTTFVQQSRRQNTPRAKNSLFLTAQGVARFLNASRAGISSRFVQHGARIEGQPAPGRPPPSYSL